MGTTQLIHGAVVVGSHRSRHSPGADPAAGRSVGAALRARARARGGSLEQSLRDLLTAAAREGESLLGELARLRAITPAAGRSLDVAAPDPLARAGYWCRELDHPACDSLYVALAEQENTTLFTADQRLLHMLEQARSGLPAVIDLAGLTAA